MAARRYHALRDDRGRPAADQQRELTEGARIHLTTAIDSV